MLYGAAIVGTAAGRRNKAGRRSKAVSIAMTS